MMILFCEEIEVFIVEVFEVYLEKVKKDCVKYFMVND